MNADRKNIVMFIIGGLCTLALLMLTGAGHNNAVGRYAMEIAHRDRTHLVYVIDTATGAVRWADSMNTPFSELPEK